MGAGEEDEVLRKLDYLSLVQKVCQELETHLGFGDKVLAEFITDIGRNCDTVEEFDSKLKENGAEMPDYFVRTLLTIIHAILPPKPKEDEKPFTALKIKDGKERVKELEKEIEEEVRGRTRLHEEDDVDEYCNRGSDRRERRSDRDRDGDRVRHRDRGDRYGHREERGRHGDRDSGDRSGDRNRDERNRRNEYEEERDGERRGKRNERSIRPDEPELYAVYKGRVSRVMDTGCFVQLDDFRGKEGLVHVSQMATRRIANVKDVVKRDQEVYVKVISVTWNKLSLSMRDVDQNNGQDLLPLKRGEDDDGLRTNPSSRNEGGGTITCPYIS